MTKVMDWLTANKLSLNISKTKDILITNKHVGTESFVINSLMHSIHRCTWKSLQFFIIIIMMASFMRVS